MDTENKSLMKRIRNVKMRVKRAGKNGRKIKFKTKAERDGFLAHVREVAYEQSESAYIFDFDSSDLFIVIKMRHTLYKVKTFGELYLSVDVEKIPFATRNSIPPKTPTPTVTEG